VGNLSTWTVISSRHDAMPVALCKELGLTMSRVVAVVSDLKEK